MFINVHDESIILYWRGFFQTEVWMDKVWWGDTFHYTPTKNHKCCWIKWKTYHFVGTVPCQNPVGTVLCQNPVGTVPCQNPKNNCRIRQFGK